MKPFITITLILSFIVCLASCKDSASYSAYNAVRHDLLIIHHDKDGNLIDYAVYDDLSNIAQIRVQPHGDSRFVYVTVFGTKIHNELKRYYSVSSEVKEGFKGCIDVNIDNGIAIQVIGNTVHFDKIVDTKLIEEVELKIESGKSSMLIPSTITVIKSAEQDVAPDGE